MPQVGFRPVNHESLLLEIAIAHNPTQTTRLDIQNFDFSLAASFRQKMSDKNFGTKMDGLNSHFLQGCTACKKVNSDSEFEPE